MDIQFKRESLYERFNLSTTLKKNELLRQFQTRPDLRKELPVFIQTINNEQKLYIEELFTCFLDEKLYSVEEYLQEQKSRKEADETLGTISFRKKLSALVNAIRRFDEVVSVLKISGKVFDELVLSTCHYDEIKVDLQYSHVDNTGEIFSAFCDCLWNEIDLAISSAVKSQNSKTVNSTYRILSAVSDAGLKKRFINAFALHTSEFFDSFASRLEDEQVYISSIDFVCGLNVSLFKNKEIYPSFKFFCGKLASNTNGNESHLFKAFPKLFERLKPTDSQVLFEGFISCCFDLIKFENIEHNTFDKISKTAETARQILQQIDEQDIEIENTDVVNILIGLADNGEEWYCKYQKHIKNIKSKQSLSDSLYEVCTMIYHSASLKNYRIAFCNLLSEASGFDTELAVMAQKKERLENVCETTKNKGKYCLYSTIKNQIGDEIPTPRDIDNFIVKYYALSILNAELRKVFVVFQQVVFAPLIMVECVPDIRFGYGGGLTPKGEFMKDLFMELPNDWTLDLGNQKITVNDFLRSKLSCYSGSNYGYSKSKAYMAKCNEATSVRRTQKTTGVTSSRSASSTSSAQRDYIPQRNTTTSTYNIGKIICGVLSALAFLIMIICFACEAPVGGVILLIGAIALLIGCIKYDDIKDNNKALAAIIIIPIVLCFIFAPIVADSSGSSSSTGSQSSQSSSGTTGNGNQNSTYTITLNKDGGSGGTNSVEAEYGEKMPSANAPSKSGYKFGGYYTSKNGNGTQYYTASMSSARTWNKSINTTLYAYWIKDNSITLTTSNFEDYFTINVSGTSSNGYATVSYSIAPKSSLYASNSDSDTSISVQIQIGFYHNQTTSFPTSSETVTLTLYRSSGYKASGTRTCKLNSLYSTYYVGATVKSCRGTIYK